MSVRRALTKSGQNEHDQSFVIVRGPSCPIEPAPAYLWCVLKSSGAREVGTFAVGVGVLFCASAPPGTCIGALEVPCDSESQCVCRSHCSHKSTHSCLPCTCPHHRPLGADLSRDVPGQYWMETPCRMACACLPPHRLLCHGMLAIFLVHRLHRALVLSRC